MKWHGFIFVLFSAFLTSCSHQTNNKESDRLPTSVDSPKAPTSPNTSPGPWAESVTNESGPVILPKLALPFSSQVATATIQPWSSWWYPKIEDEKENSGSLQSALIKYDLYRRARYGSAMGSAADYETSAFNGASASWEGLCDAWSLASILSPQPRRPVSFKIGDQIVTFTIGDLKAILLKTYNAVPDTELKYYGQRFTGDENGWDYPDLYPDQFHRFIEVQLFQKHQAFIMDHDPGIEVWNVPVFKANYKMTAVPNDPDSVFVQTWLYSAENSATDQRDFVGTRQGVREYNYILHGTRNHAGDLVIYSGEWIKGSDGVDSIADHPDFMTTIPDPAKITRQSDNPEIDPKVVDEILTNAF